MITKTNLQKIAAAIAAVTLLGAAELQAQQTVVTTNSDGTISEFSPDTFVIRSQSSPEPIRYSYSKTTTYVDEAGNPVSQEVVRSGVPVTVSYVREGDRLIANRVIVHRARTTTVVPSATTVVPSTTTVVPSTTTVVPRVEETRTTTTTTTTK